MTRETIYLIDGTSLCYRSFFALKLSTSKGFPTGAIYGVHQTLKKIFSQYKPSYLSVCFDVSRKTFRTEKYEKYKVNRPPLPDGLGAQLPHVKKLLAALGVSIIEKEGFEADDIIASLCQKALADNFSVVIVSVDKDLYQLLTSKHVMLYNYNRDELIGREAFFKEYGFSPEQIIDYLSLTGDASDNVPGARGIGKVGAAKLIKEFGDIDNIFAHLDAVDPKWQKILTKHKDDVLLSRELITLNPCPLQVNWNDLRMRDPDNEILYEMFHDFEFKALLKNIPAASGSPDIPVCDGIGSDSLTAFCGKEVSFFRNGENIFIYNPRQHCVHRLKWPGCKDILADESVKKITYAYKDQADQQNDLFAKGLYFDVKIAAYVFDSSLPDYSLGALASHCLGERLKDIPCEHYPYYIDRLYHFLSERIRQERLDKLFFDIEMPLIEVLYSMQCNGIKVDSVVLENLLAEVERRIEGAKRETFRIAGREFNLNSPKQLQAVLFSDLKIKPIKRTKTGFSTNEEVLEKLAPDHPIAAAILDHRYLSKLKNTYIVPLIEEVRKKQGMLHARFHQTSTQTGRLSSSSPNLQSIPVKGELSGWLRRAFISSFKKGILLSGDYSQVELRILAHLSGDHTLCDAFRRDLDIHAVTASLLFGIDVAEVDQSQRSLAKRVNFGIIYGMSSYGLSKELHISTQEAQQFIDDYFRRYQGVRHYIDTVYRQVESRGYVETILGRRRNLPDINSSNLQMREFARRQAVNAPIQGSCADLIKLAMVRIYRELTRRRLKTKLILQIHDELIFDVPEDECDSVSVFIREYMENVWELAVPIRVNLKVGNNWGQMQTLA